MFLTGNDGDDLKHQIQIHVWISIRDRRTLQRLNEKNGLSISAAVRGGIELLRKKLERRPAGVPQQELLADIERVFDDEHADRLFSTDICKALTAMEGRPWAEWVGGKPITPKQLAHLLKRFDVVTNTTIRVGARTAKGYHRHQFERLWKTYFCRPTQGRERSQVTRER